jgi:hypothetical protein
MYIFMAMHLCLCYLIDMKVLVYGVYYYDHKLH